MPGQDRLGRISGAFTAQWSHREKGKVSIWARRRIPASKWPVSARQLPPVPAQHQHRETQPGDVRARVCPGKGTGWPQIKTWSARNRAVSRRILYMRVWPEEATHG